MELIIKINSYFLTLKEVLYTSIKDPKMIKLNGVFPPLPTAFDEDQNLDTHNMNQNISRLNQFDLAGYLLLGSNGELVMLTEEEKIKVYNDCRKAIPASKLMIAGTGGLSTLETIRLTKAAGNAGADAALVLNPFYYKGLMTAEALKKHYFDVADASEIPIIIYNMPANSGMDMSAELIAKFSTHPNIIGLKDSGGNLTKMGDIKRLVNPDFQIIAGSAGFLLPALTIGAIGGILALANIAPQKCIDIYENFNQNNLDEAREIQLKMIPINSTITSGMGVPALKYAMDFLGLYGGISRKPIQPLNENQKQIVKQLLIDNEISHF